MGRRRGLCWQGCRGVSWAVVSMGWEYRLAARWEGPVKDTLLGVPLKQCLVKTQPHTTGGTG